MRVGVKVATKYTYYNISLLNSGDLKPTTTLKDNIPRITLTESKSRAYISSLKYRISVTIPMISIRTPNWIGSPANFKTGD